MRQAILTLLGLLWALSSHAFQVLPDGRAERLLKCLVNASTPAWAGLERLLPPQSRVAAPHHLMRLKLRFERADAAPRVEVLANTMGAATQKAILAYLQEHRLPCLPADDEPIYAIQEFSVDSDGSIHTSAALPWTEASGAVCIVMPVENLEIPYSRLEDPIVRTLIEGRFEGDGTQPPKVRILHSNGGRWVRESVEAHVRKYRMPCRRAGDAPQNFEQMFAVSFTSSPAPQFREPEVTLERFITFVKNKGQLNASFDFDTMACPFDVTWTLRRPHMPNRALEEGQRNPNRVPFLRWLELLDLDMDARTHDWLFDESMKVRIPCGRFTLTPAR